MIVCPFCKTPFDSADAWCPHFIGLQHDLTLDDYKDFISGEYPAETLADSDGNTYYFLKRTMDEDKSE